ncbi:putative DNA-directed DNA polymerase [Dioscorea sansibarensis]
MTRAVHSDNVEDENSAIGIHLRSHAHLTNCIHMHCHSPIAGERSLVKDLTALQRSRSLRDPLTHPLSRSSPPTIGASNKKHRKDGGMESERVATSKVAAAEALSEYQNDGIGVKDAESSIGVEASKKKYKSHRGLLPQTVNTRSRKVRHTNTDEQNGQADHGTRKFSHIYHHRLHNGKGDPYDVAGTSGLGHYDEPDFRTKSKFRRGKSVRSSINSRGAKGRIDMVSASNLMARASKHQEVCIGHEGGEITEGEVSLNPRNGCGIPLNWSRIHSKGKTFLDIAGRSLSCGLSDSRLRKAKDTVPQVQRRITNAPLMFPSSSPSVNSDSDSLPLLIEPSESHESSESSFLTGGSSADQISRQEQDSEFASEARSGSLHACRRCHSGNHQNFTQKYAPKTFKDVVGQNLVVQALSNAILRRKVGFMYIFYGPHGTGKTSCAHVFAKALNCRSVERPNPCDSCSSCISYNLGKTQNVLEVGLIGGLDFKSIMDALYNSAYILASHYKVLIIDDSDTLLPDSWCTISRVIDRAPQSAVFIFVCSELDHLPHSIVSRCQKFFFPKLKESSIVHALQFISNSEGLEIDNDALKLIASRADGSLRDAEMTLDQLSLLGQRVSLPVVQELVGLVSDDKLVDLLDLALSANTSNTIKSVRDAVESGVDPLELMSQLAATVTDILAGRSVFNPERPQRNFFRHPTLSKEDMAKLRQALKILSEAEKQMRASNDKMTWLTAALLQLAPDQQYMLHDSFVNRSDDHKPTISHEQRIPVVSNGKLGGLAVSDGTQQISNNDNDKLWCSVVENLQREKLKQFIHEEGKLVSISSDTPVPIVKLAFSSQAKKLKAEKFRGEITRAIEAVIHSAIILEISCELKNVDRDNQFPSTLPSSGYGSVQIKLKQKTATNQRLSPSDHHDIGRNEITEIVASPDDYEDTDRRNNANMLKNKGWQSALGEATSSQHHRMENGKPHQTRSLVRGKVSLAQIIQQSKGSLRQNGWSRYKPISIAEKLELENLSLEPRTRSLCCWRSSKITRGKVPRLRMRRRKSNSFLKVALFKRCLCARSPRTGQKENAGFEGSFEL